MMAAPAKTLIVAVTIRFAMPSGISTFQPSRISWS